MSIPSSPNSDDLEDFPGRLLHQAALWDNAELLEDLLHADQLQHIDGVDAWGRTPLHAAATTENSSCLRILLQSGANPNIPCGPRGEYRTSLHVTAEYGHVNNLRLLLSHDARIDVRDGLGFSPLDLALKGSHIECASALKTAQSTQEACRVEIFNGLLKACIEGSPDLMLKLFKELKEDLQLVINMMVEGSNTLLFKASEIGHREIVHLLLANGADARVHPVTKYSPLYIACYNGHKEVVELLLRKFPELVQTPTVEKWFPSHGCCIQGHVQVLDLLLKYPYPSSIMKKYTDKTGNYEYELPFDINAKDVSGQTVLYIAAYMGNLKMVELILKYRVKGKTLKSNDQTTTVLSATESITAKKRISDSIQALMSRLNVNLKPDSATPAANIQQTLSPVDVDVYCDHGTQTALHAAVKSKHFAIASLILGAGANPNLTIYLNEEELSKLRSRTALDEYVFTGSSVLVEAVRQRDMGMIDLLLKHGARDLESKALYVAVQAKDDIITSKLLALKSHIDRENSINKKAGSPNESRGFASLSQVFPTNAVMINWHGQQCLEYIRQQWLSEAAVSLNPKMKLHPRAYHVALHSITRIDLSNNVLVELPPCMLQLQSIRHLNVAQNKIERLPSGLYNCPLLEELLLQDNRLDFLPDALFKLPSLAILDVSNNKLQHIPIDMWTAPKLKEMNASFNLLVDLPNFLTDVAFDLTSSGDSGKKLDFSAPRSNKSTPDKFNLSFSDEDSLGDARMMRSMQLATFNLTPQKLVHDSLWSHTVDINETLPADMDDMPQSCSQLVHLNLAHNNFSSVPVSLACIAVNLVRLNMSFNKLTDIGPLSNYPHGLKQLDLSHNQIENWPPFSNWDILQLDEPMSPLSTSSPFLSSSATITCFAGIDRNPPKTPVTQGRKFHKSSKVVACAHRRHHKLEGLRTLVLGDNQMTGIHLWMDEGLEEDVDTLVSSAHKSKLLFPNLSALDISNNRIREIPNVIHELSNLAVFNVSGNPDIVELPPRMGLLSKLWNLNVRGCNLQEPLRSMIESKKYKTMDVVGYLKSILEDARPYARMKLMLVGVQGIGKTSLLEQLRQEGTGSYKKKPPEHWAKRMGNRNIHSRTPRGVNLSTVGVDIGDWTYDKKAKGHGPVTFRTWDFAGQKEYYATHQYFLSKRSLYLVLWRITDGVKGIDEIFHWLVNIQARAPNSPVLIVGTHYDLVKDTFPSSYSEDLQQLVRDRFINVVDAEKCGLPRVLDTIEISCRTRHNVRLLCNLIYDAVFSLKLPGSKERMLEQRIPATYLALEDVIGLLATEQKNCGRDPVLSAEEYRVGVAHIMNSRFRMSFRDTAELNQATAFLHENGVMLHYEDATLKDLYFLDPQWLCDMLAHVVTIREINPFAPNGIMRLEDLQLVFRSSTSAPAEAQAYVVNLLNKFEVALTWDSRTLLIPSLLPTEDQTAYDLPGSDVRVKIPVRSRGRAMRPRKGPRFNRAVSMPSRPGSAAAQGHKGFPPEETVTDGKCEVSFQSDMETAIYRLLLLSYVPTGFWSRLITRLLAEDSIVDTLRSYFNIPRHVDADLTHTLEWKAEWRCWQTGIELHYLGTTLLRIKEVANRVGVSPFDYRAFRYIAKQEGHWSELDTASAAMIEIFLPNETIAIRKPIFDRPEGQPFQKVSVQGYQTFALEPSVESVTKLLTISVDHIDTLLEDWYPILGTRFVHTSEGKYLVTRLVPCPMCLCGLNPPADSPHERPQENHQFFPLKTEPVARGSRNSARSEGADSGVGHESPVLSRKTSTEEHSNIQELLRSHSSHSETVYSFTVEECILLSHGNRHVHCPVHNDIHLAQVAPDTMFMDIGERNIVNGQNIKRGGLLGRGAFGFVYRATANINGNPNAEVAVKMLQPIDPGHEARSSVIQIYKAAISQWERDPLQYACKAYCTVRQELAILLTLRHANIVPFIGLCTEPLALVLDLAPLGALDSNLRNFRRSGAKLNLSVIQQIVVQIAKALEYLHQQRIIYRDLKSENVLVWSLPSPDERQPEVKVDVKLADYGISRISLPTGAKGFGGTEGFMAPEIMRFNGEEEYTDKVDCFSFGMFLYELLTLRQPFESHESVKEFILEGGRPSITPRDATHPVYLLDLMVLCWSQQPKDRPTASQIVSIASAPEFTHLLDVVSLNHNGFCTDGIAVPVPNSSEETLHELWLSSTACQVDLLLASSQPPEIANGCGSWLDYYTLESEIDQPVTAACLVGESVWLGDARGQIFCFSTRTYQCLFRYSLEPDSSCTASIRRLIHLPSLHRVAVALANGRLFLCRDDFIPLTSTQGEGTFVMTELGLGGSGAPLHCMAAIYSTSRGKVELWCGQSQGSICVFALGEGVVIGQELINHYDPVLPGLEVLQIVAVDNLIIENHVDSFDYEEEMPNENVIETTSSVIWSYVYPGCVVYRWCANTRRILHRLDCSKLAPCSESLQSISIEEHLSPGRCQVTSLAVQGRELYIGTTWGCLIVAEASSLRPITVFRPYEDEIRVILPLSSYDKEKEKQSLLVATIGKGYRNLLHRYGSWTHFNKSSSGYVSERNQNMQVLLWRAGDWI